MQIARRLVEGAPDVDAIRRDAAAFGLAAVVDEPSPVDVWPEHESALALLLGMSTQVNVGGAGGLIGYRYEALPVVYAAIGGKRKRWPQTFSDFQVLEREVNRLIRERSH